MVTATADPAVRALVNQIARRHCGPAVDLDELIGAGMLAACQAAERFNPAKGSLVGFLRRRVEGAIIDAARRDCSPILTPRGCQPLRTVGDSQREGQGDGLVTLADLVSDYRGDHHPDLWAMVDALPIEQAEILRTRYQSDGLTRSLADTAKALGRTDDDVARGEEAALAVLRCRLDDLDHPRPFTDEEPTMSRLNGFHAPEPTDVATTEEPTDGKRCPSCDRRFKNLKVNRCYYRDCPASGYAATSTASKGKAKASKRRPVAVRPSAAVDATVAPTGAAPSLTDEIQIMSLMAGLVPAARQRVLSWARSAFGV